MDGKKVLGKAASNLHCFNEARYFTASQGKAHQLSLPEATMQMR
jgi:hypothetical protein